MLSISHEMSFTRRAILVVAILHLCSFVFTAPPPLFSCLKGKGKCIKAVQSDSTSNESPDSEDSQVAEQRKWDMSSREVKKFISKGERLFKTATASFERILNQTNTLADFGLWPTGDVKIAPEPWEWLEQATSNYKDAVAKLDYQALQLQKKVEEAQNMAQNSGEPSKELLLRFARKWNSFVRTASDGVPHRTYVPDSNTMTLPSDEVGKAKYWLGRKYREYFAYTDEAQSFYKLNTSEHEEYFGAMAFLDGVYDKVHIDSRVLADSKFDSPRRQNRNRIPGLYHVQSPDVFHDCQGSFRKDRDQEAGASSSEHSHKQHQYYDLPHPWIR